MIIKSLVFSFIVFLSFYKDFRIAGYFSFHIHKISFGFPSVLVRNKTPVNHKTLVIATFNIIMNLKKNSYILITGVNILFIPINEFTIHFKYVK